MENVEELFVAPLTFALFYTDLESVAQYFEKFHEIAVAELHDYHEILVVLLDAGIDVEDAEKALAGLLG